MRCADGADVDDHAAITLREILLTFLAQAVHQAERIDAECLFQHFVGHIGDGRVVVHHARAVDGDIQLAECLNCLFDHADGDRWVTDIARVQDHFTGSVLAFLGQLLQAFFAAGDRHDLRALAAEQLRRGAPDPGGSAGHDADFTL